MDHLLNVVRFPDSQFGRVAYGPAGRYGPLIQRESQIIILHRGHVDLITEQGIFRIVAGQCRLLPKNTSFELHFSSLQETEHTWCLLSSDIVEANELADLLTEKTVSTSHHLNSMVTQALEMDRSNFKCMEHYLNRLAECVFHEYFRLTAMLNRSDTEICVEHGIDIMRRRLHETLSVEMIALDVGMSRQHFSKIFREHTGQPVARYLWEMRVKKAHALLIGTGLGLAEIAEHTGFQDPFHLSRKIKQRFGQSPREIRKSILKQTARS
jgi:AraC-like DNA-binding protein